MVGINPGLSNTNVEEITPIQYKYLVYLSHDGLSLIYICHIHTLIPQYRR